MRKELSRTAMYMALYRALETVQRRRTPLFRDRFAVRVLPVQLRAGVWAARRPTLHRWLSRYVDRRAPGARTSAIGRTRFIDDVVRRCVDDGIEQVVMLGAGFDCRAHRMDELRSCRLFEVDRRAMQELKRSRMACDPANVRYVCIDFLKDDTFARLREAGWSERERTLFIWEGVTGYLSEKAVADVLAQVGGAAPGTTIVFTYLHRGVLDGTVGFEGADRMLRTVRALGEPWTFGLAPEEVGPFVGRFGLSLREDLGANEYRARYLHENVCGYAFHRIAVAEV
jgi:methyltransferase (TIGR00027 family)